MSRQPPIPRKSIYRFSLYLRCLQGLNRENVATVSSETLAKAAKVNAAQLRKDLTYLGHSGRRGFGYKVTELKDRIDSLMGTNQLTPIVLVGVGNLGAALLSYQGFEEVGFGIVGAFDTNWDRVRPKDSPLSVQPMEKLGAFISDTKIKLAILAVPAHAAQPVANQLVEYGIRGILNFSPVLLEVPDDVLAHNVNVAIELQNLASLSANESVRESIMKVPLAYGTGYLEVELPDDFTTVITPAEQEGLRDEKQRLFDALDAPVGSAALREQIKPDSRICIVFTDITRSTPNERLIPWILDYLAGCGVRNEQITLLNALGTHRPNSRAQLSAMLTPQVVENYRVLNHEPENPDALAQLGVTSAGAPALINKHLVEADVRIITGFIEPHFFAGFSGGPKGIMPGVAGMETVISNHGRRNIASPNAAFGITSGNPIWEEMRDIALRVGRSFLVNVTLNEKRAITGIFAGDLIAAHKEGIEFVRKSAMQPVSEPFDIVITTNSGYPLDQNLYQSVKGMSAAARIVRQGGAIIIAAECRQGLPEGSPFDQLLRKAKDPEDILALIAKETFPEQWQAQIQALIQRKAAIHIYSALPGAAIRAAHLLPCANISATVAKICENINGAPRIAALPQGPLTIPYLKSERET